MKQPKTIFITSFFGLIARNILATAVLKTLDEQASVRIVILTPENKREQYQKKFGSERVIIEGVEIKKQTKIEKLFAILFNHLSDTRAWRIHRLIYRKRTGNYVMGSAYWLLSKLGHLKMVRRIARWAEAGFSPKDKYREYFEKYKPDLVFATDVFKENDIDV